MASSEYARVPSIRCAAQIRAAFFLVGLHVPDAPFLPVSLFHRFPWDGVHAGGAALPCSSGLQQGKLAGKPGTTHEAFCRNWPLRISLYNIHAIPENKTNADHHHQYRPNGRRAWGS